MQDRDQNCANKGSGFSIPFYKNDGPSLVHHLNQLQVLTQYFITVHWAIRRLPTGFWPLNHTCWVSHTLPAVLHAACWCHQPRLSLQAGLPTTPSNCRLCSLPFSPCSSCFPTCWGTKEFAPRELQISAGLFRSFRSWGGNGIITERGEREEKSRWAPQSREWKVKWALEGLFITRSLPELSCFWCKQDGDAIVTVAGLSHGTHAAVWKKRVFFFICGQEEVRENKTNPNLWWANSAFYCVKPPFRNTESLTHITPGCVYWEDHRAITHW